MANETESPAGGAIKDQPTPIANSGIPVWSLVIADMRDRDNIGRQRYGTPLQTHNGRDALVDVYQEILDAAVYLRQEIQERADKDDSPASERAIAAAREVVYGHEFMDVTTVAAIIERHFQPEQKAEKATERDLLRKIYEAAIDLTYHCREIYRTKGILITGLPELIEAMRAYDHAWDKSTVPTVPTATESDASLLAELAENGNPFTPREVMRSVVEDREAMKQGAVTAERQRVRQAVEGLPATKRKCGDRGSIEWPACVDEFRADVIAVIEGEK